MRWPGFCGPSAKSQSVMASPERLMNWYCQRIRQPDGTFKLVLYPSPGLTQFSSPPETPGRGILSQSFGGLTARVFAVIGTTFYELFADGTRTNRGTVAQDQYPATLVTNGDAGNEVFITSGGTGYIFDVLTNVFTTAVSKVTMSGMMDGYFIALDITSSTIKISPLLNGSAAWDSTQILQRSTAPDPWRALLVRYPRVWLLGEHTGDLLYNTGASPFPFAPVPNVQIPYGIAASFTLKTVGSSVMWLSKNSSGQGQIVEAQGAQPTVISTEALEYAISQFSRIDDAVAYSYQDQGHEFYVVNFPSGPATWVYDKTEGFWHERGTWNASTGRYTIWGPQYHTHAFEKHLVLHASNGTVYAQSVNVATDAAGALIRRLRIPPLLQGDQKRLYVDRLELVLEPGLGLTTGQGSNPRVVLRMSHTAGKVWGNERSRSAGIQGAYNRRLIWHQCGSGRHPVPEITVTDPIPWRVTDLIADVRAGAA